MSTTTSLAVILLFTAVGVIALCVLVWSLFTAVDILDEKVERLRLALNDLEEHSYYPGATRERD